MTNYRHGQMINLIDEMNSPLLAVEPQRCVLVRHRNGECLRCAAVCTTGAISLGEEGIVVSPEKCIGCGTCASACPTGCLTAANPTDEELFGAVEAALAENEGRVAIACERAFAMASGNRMKQDSCDATAPSFVPGKIAGATSDGRPLVGVVCLGRVDESLLVEATARGARSIQLISGPCESCPHRCGGALSDEIIVSAETLLAALGTPSPIDRIRLQHASDTREILRLRPTASAQDDTNAVNAATVADASEDCLSESGYPVAPPQEDLQLSLPSKLVANLPYAVAATVVLDYFESFPFLDSATIMVQKEVADRMVAAVGTKNYGAYTVKLGLYAEPAGRFAVGPGNFFPPPRVDSAVIRLNRRVPLMADGAPASPEVIAAAALMADAAFTNRRKTIANSCKTYFSGRGPILLGVADSSAAEGAPTIALPDGAATAERLPAIFEAAAIDPRRRGETLTQQEFLALGAALLRVTAA